MPIPSRESFEAPDLGALERATEAFMLELSSLTPEQQVGL